MLAQDLAGEEVALWKMSAEEDEGNGEDPGLLAFIKESWPRFPTFPTLITSLHGLGSRSLCP